LSDIGFPRGVEAVIALRGTAVFPSGLELINFGIVPKMVDKLVKVAERSRNESGMKQWEPSILADA
jgi:hypothetical protein